MLTWTQCVSPSVPYQRLPMWAASRTVRVGAYHSHTLYNSIPPERRRFTPPFDVGAEGHCGGRPSDGYAGIHNHMPINWRGRHSSLGAPRTPSAHNLTPAPVHHYTEPTKKHKYQTPVPEVLDRQKSCRDAVVGVCGRSLTAIDIMLNTPIP